MLRSKPQIWLLMGILSAATLVLLGFDHPISSFLQKHLALEIITAAKLFSDIGIAFFYSIFAILLIYSYFKNSRRLKKVIWAYLKAQILFSFLMVRILKIGLGRARPKYGSEFTFFSMEADYNSFPSGHAADAFVSGVFLYYLLKYSRFAKYRVLPLILAFLTAASRIAGVTHFSSDAVAGTAIGIFGAYFFISRLESQPQE